MITKFARLEFELFTKQSNPDFLLVHQFLGTFLTDYSEQQMVTDAD